MDDSISFKRKLEQAMQDLGINQKQLSGMTGIGKSSISQYLSGKNIPARERQKEIALALGLDGEYFTRTDNAAALASLDTKVRKLLVTDAARLLGIGVQTVREGLQQGVFPWGYAIKTGENRWTYFINAARFAEIERIYLDGAKKA